MFEGFTRRERLGADLLPEAVRAAERGDSRCGRHAGAGQRRDAAGEAQAIGNNRDRIHLSTSCVLLLVHRSAARFRHVVLLDLLDVELLRAGGDLVDGLVEVDRW